MFFGFRTPQDLKLAPEQTTTCAHSLGSDVVSLSILSCWGRNGRVPVVLFCEVLPLKATVVWVFMECWKKNREGTAYIGIGRCERRVLIKALWEIWAVEKGKSIAFVLFTWHNMAQWCKDLKVPRETGDG